jgi:cation:H+ antiporter
VPGSLVGGRTIAAIAAAAIFVAGLALTLIASEVFTRGLTRLGTKLGFSEGLIGLLAAVGADSPELSAAIAALLAGAGSVGVGVVLGSNLFNIAALLGLSAVVAGRVNIRRAPLLLDAGVGVFVTVASAAMLGRLLSPAATVAVIVPFAVAYVAILAMPRARLRAAGPLLRSVPQSAVEIAYEVTHDQPAVQHRSWLPVAGIPFALGGVVGGSFLMVHEALIAEAWLHLSTVIVGTIVLAALTSLPNLYVALHFARNDRGTALFSSAMNSNTINLVGGLVIPAVFVGLGPSQGSLPYFLWLFVLTLLVALPPLQRGRLSRTAGSFIIAIYLGFVVLRVLGF